MIAKGCAELLTVSKGLRVLLHSMTYVLLCRLWPHMHVGHQMHFRRVVPEHVLECSWGTWVLLLDKVLSGTLQTRNQLQDGM